jgi:hypothetical protein
MEFLLMSSVVNAPMLRMAVARAITPEKKVGCGYI